MVDTEPLARLKLMLRCALISREKNSLTMRRQAASHHDTSTTLVCSRSRLSNTYAWPMAARGPELETGERRREWKASRPITKNTYKRMRDWRAMVTVMTMAMAMTDGDGGDDRL